MTMSHDFRRPLPTELFLPCRAVPRWFVVRLLRIRFFFVLRLRLRRHLMLIIITFISVSLSRCLCYL